MTTTPKTVEELDEMRISAAIRKFSLTTPVSKAGAKAIARAIREADEAAGLDVVPREATADMYERGCEVDDVDWDNDLNLSDSDVPHQTVNIGKIWDAMRDAGRITGDGG